MDMFLVAPMQAAVFDLLKNPKSIDDRQGLVRVIHRPWKQVTDAHIFSFHAVSLFACSPQITPQFTNALSFVGKLPQGTDLSNKLNDGLITVLYNTLIHPPATYIGTDVPSSVQPQVTINATAATADAPAPTGPVPRMPFAFRSADGSGNNPLAPNIGKAGTSYARSVQNKHPLAPNMLPDTGEVFDALLKARDVSPLLKPP